MNTSQAAQLLGVDIDARSNDIAAAYRTAAKHAHPDHGGNPEQFRQLTDARDTLTAHANRREDWRQKLDEAMQDARERRQRPQAMTAVQQFEQLVRAGRYQAACVIASEIIARHGLR